MSYFSDSYPSLRFPIGNPGYREAQLAAVQAVTAHFFSSTEPALVVMPTGSGKTAVLATLAFTLRATRVLVLTPSRLVREQIAAKFRELEDLRKIDALPVLHPSPTVATIEERITAPAQWESLRQFDVVVAVVNSISGIKQEVPDPPPDLFDLVIVDEGHHAPAAIWARVLRKLSGARQVLLTATPFRRDEKEIKGKLAFIYDVRRAHRDGVFGDLTFQAVSVTPDQNVDLAIARAAERKLRADRSLGFKHLLMVRVDSIARGKQLRKLYADETRLNLEFVTGASSLAKVRKVVEKLRKQELDGVVCVNMFGEGFDLPNLKVAAVHSPHKSLAVTLQFIGRFARTNSAEIGKATFLAEPHSQESELGELWTSGAPWPEIIANLSAARVAQEASSRAVLETFDVEMAPELADFGLGALRPYFHVKILECPDGVDLSQHLDFPENTKVVFRGISGAEGAVVYITQEITKARWSIDVRIQDVRFDLYVCHYAEAKGLLFLCSSRRASDVYVRLASQLCLGSFRPLSASFINRALNDLQGAEFFNVGMRKRQVGGRSESYRMIFGPHADKAVQEQDGRLYDRGHCFGKGQINGEDVTIGISTASKVWSNRADPLPDLIEWCDALADRIGSGIVKPTGSGLDRLSTGKPLTEVPSGIVAGMWPLRAYQDPGRVTLPSDDLFADRGSLVDLDIEILSSRKGATDFRVRGKNLVWDATFAFDDGAMIRGTDPQQEQPQVGRGDRLVPLSDYLTEHPPRFFTEDFSAVEGPSLFPPPSGQATIDAADFEVVDWAQAGVSIELEKGSGGPKRSLFEWLEARLRAGPSSVIYDDDGAGEVADFIAAREIEGEPVISLYHCKASGSPQAGSRVSDLYDVCGQAVRSGAWIASMRLVERLEGRTQRRASRGCVVGSVADLKKAFAPEKRQRVRFELFIVQPGLSNRARRESANELLLATKNYAVGSGFDRFGIIVSA